MRTLPTILLFTALAISCDRAPAKPPKIAPPPPSANAPTSSLTLDLLLKSYAPHTTPDDALGFPMKVRNLSKDLYRFWRGGKEHFYHWSRTHAADWLADRPAYLIIHGDLHPGNFGVYLATGKLGESVAVGPIDFDESARLPFQFELLQGAVMLDLLAENRRIRRTEAGRDKTLATLFDAYRAALDSGKNPTQLLSEDKWIADAIADVQKRHYSRELARFVEDDAFPMHPDKAGKSKEILRTIEASAKFTKAIDEALWSAANATDMFSDRRLRKQGVLAVAMRTSLESAGSEGLSKYLILVKEKRAPGNNQLIFNLKQQIPSSAERAGLIPTDVRPPAQRSVEQSRILVSPPSYFAGWCTLDGKSLRLSLKEPWTDSIEAASKVDSEADLSHLAQIWGTIAGAIHGRQEARAEIRTRLTPELLATLKTRSAEYLAAFRIEYEAFLTDPRRAEYIRRAEAALEPLIK